MRKIVILGFTVLLLIPSCLVSKKKYDNLYAENQKIKDSSEYVIDKTIYDCKKQKQAYEDSLSRNKNIIDSLIIETGKLSKDTSHLSSSLANALNEYNKKQKILNETEARLNKKMELIKRLTKEQEIKSKEIDSLRTSLEEKQKRLASLEKMIAKNKAEVNKLKNIINDALKSFDNSELNVYLKDGKVYVAMEEKLMFKTGSSEIDKRGKEALIKLGKILEKNTDTEILIEGHTDNTGPDKYNWKLSTERALSVVDILTKNTNIKPSRITASGRGMHKPAADNNTETGRQKNRRIEIILVPKLDSLYKIMNE
ncbi:MAG: OmpA family protein [Chlorobi bacterium]|nr:OmpA family protein [Chlorobiota bacterium]